MILLVGLGNPGGKYTNTRHNVGFLFCDFFLKELTSEIPLVQTKLDAEIIELKDKNIIVAKPQKYMNTSGIVVKKLVTRYRLQVSQIIVAHDDLDITLGNFKIQQGTGPKVHNGIASLQEHIGTDFWRIRIGVDNRSGDRSMPGEAYVLQNFAEQETHQLSSVFSDIIKRCKELHLFGQNRSL